VLALRACAARREFTRERATRATARELGAKGLHVAHTIIDGVIDGEQVNGRCPQLEERLDMDGMLAPDGIAEADWQLHGQARSAWTLELVLRPYKESF
jgi:hypothetical protein